MVLILGLSACGYQLRGSGHQAQLPDSLSIYADDQQLADAMAKALSMAQVNVVIKTQAVSTDEGTAISADLRFSNTKAERKAVIYDTNGEATHWRYSVSTSLLLGQGEDSKSFTLQEYQQVALNADAGAGSANDVIITTTWQQLYTALAQGAINLLGRQP
jgi:outer membrane lipopolysaccharide assembly protein LptE/RlpB